MLLSPMDALVMREGFGYVALTGGAPPGYHKLGKFGSKLAADLGQIWCRLNLVLIFYWQAGGAAGNFGLGQPRSTRD